MAKVKYIKYIVLLAALSILFIVIRGLLLTRIRHASFPFTTRPVHMTATRIANKGDSNYLTNNVSRTIVSIAVSQSTSAGFKTVAESPGKAMLQFPEATEQVLLFEGNITINKPRLLPNFESYERGCSFYPRQMKVKLRSQRHRGARLTLLTSCVATGHRGYDAEMRALSIQNKIDYCALHGYHFVDGSQAPKYLPGPHLHWQKPPLLRQLLYTSDWLVWMDCDSLVINFSVPLHHFIDDNFDFIATHDWNGLNTGVYFQRSSVFSERLLDTQICLKPSVDATKVSFLAEQLALVKCFEAAKGLQKHVKIIPQHFINSYTTKRKATWRPGEFVGHNVDCGTTKCFDGFKQLARTVRDFWRSTKSKSDGGDLKFHATILWIIATMTSP